MEDYVPRLHTVDPQAANPPNQRADIALISTSLPNPDAVTLIDVTLAAHNRQHGGLEYSVGAAAILRAREKHDMYDLTFDFSSDGADGDILILTQSDLRYRDAGCAISRGTPVSSCPCCSNRSPQSWLTVQQHSQIISVTVQTAILD